MRFRVGPDPVTGVSLIVAILAISSSGPLIAFAAAPALAIAFWRNAMAIVVLAPVAVIRRRDELRSLIGSREGLFCVLAGVALAGHFATWVPSTKLTTIATATALVATQPVWQGLIAVGQGRRLPLFEVPGAALLGWAWLGQVPRPTAIPGLLVLVAGVVIAVLAGQRARDGGAKPVEEPEAGVITP